MAESDAFNPRDRVESVLAAASLATNVSGDEASDSELIADLAAAEALSLTLADRLRAAVGNDVVLTLATQDHTAGRLRGAVEHVSADHVVLRVDFGLVVVALNAIASVTGLGAGARTEVAGAVRWTWRATLRRWLGQEVVVYQTTTGNVRGRLERVAADHIDLAAAAGNVTVSWAHVVAVFNHHANDVANDDLLA